MSAPGTRLFLKPTAGVISLPALGAILAVVGGVLLLLWLPYGVPLTGVGLYLLSTRHLRFVRLTPEQLEIETQRFFFVSNRRFPRTELTATLHPTGSLRSARHYELIVRHGRQRVLTIDDREGLREEQLRWLQEGISAR